MKKQNFKTQVKQFKNDDEMYAAFLKDEKANKNIYKVKTYEALKESAA